MITLEQAIHANYSIKLLYSLYDRDLISGELRRLSSAGFCKLNLSSETSYTVLNSELEQNRLYEKLRKCRQLPVQDTSTCEMEYFIRNNMGEISIADGQLTCVVLNKPNPLQKKLQQNRSISSSSDLQQLSLRGKIELIISEYISDYTLTDESIPRINNKTWPTLTAFGNFMEQVSEFFIRRGYNRVTSKPVVRCEDAFDSLLCDEFHPARELQDTFYVKSEEAPLCLRPHLTGSVFSRYKDLKIKSGRYFEISKVFRNEREDKTHTCEFFQLEIEIFEDNLKLGNIKEIFLEFFREGLGISCDITISPTYYPYTAPSAEVNLHRNGQVMEIAGGGMFRSEVLALIPTLTVNSGIGIGMGLERLFLLAHPEYSGGDIRGLFLIESDNE